MDYFNGAAKGHPNRMQTFKHLTILPLVASLAHLLGIPPNTLVDRIPHKEIIENKSTPPFPIRNDL